MPVTRQVFSSVSTTIFSTFSCDLVEDLDVWLLRADYSIICHGNDYVIYQVLHRLLNVSPVPAQSLPPSRTPNGFPLVPLSLLFCSLFERAMHSVYPTYPFVSFNLTSVSSSPPPTLIDCPIRTAKGLCRGHDRRVPHRHPDAVCVPAPQPSGQDQPSCSDRASF